MILLRGQYFAEYKANYKKNAYSGASGRRSGRIRVLPQVREKQLSTPEIYSKLNCIKLEVVITNEEKRKSK